MIERIVSVTIFLTLVLALRAVFHNRISKRVCYAMWLVVSIYLLVPSGVFSNPFQILNVFYRVAAVDNGSEVRKQEYSQPVFVAERNYVKKEGADDSALGESSAAYDLDTPENDTTNNFQMAAENEVSQDTAPTLSVAGKEQANESRMGGDRITNRTEESLWIKRLWIAGCMICAIVFTGSNLHFAKRLRSSRKLLETDGKCSRILGSGYLSVYQTEEIHIPCLFGAVHPAIYLPMGQMESERCEYVLAHEYTHYRHGDHIWAVIRILCVILYWYHPLVWMAALLSERDSEFACDESVIRRFDAEQRRAYGETLILFGTGGKDGMRLFTGSTGMNGSDQELKKRIMIIAAQGKRCVGTAVAVCVLLLGVTGCTVGSPAVGNVEGESDSIIESRDEEDKVEELTEAEGGDIQTEDKGDLVPEPIHFADILDKTEENGIEYYKVVTEKEMPLPLNEWAKINIFTEKGTAVDAYVRFTQVLRDVEEVETHINHYMEAMAIKEPFGMMQTDKAQYVLLQYEIMVAEDALIEEGDKIPPMALDHPLRLYSTLESGRFTVQGIERSVCDITVSGQDSIEPGDTIQKEVVCYIPADYTAYGIEFAYMTARRTTDMVYFKPEYE